MQPCNRIYYSSVHWQLNMFRAAYRSSSGALTVFAASGLHTHVVNGRSQVWVGTLDHGRAPHACVNQTLQIQLELLMMNGMPLETCWAVKERWNNKFCYKVASCWLFLLSHTTMRGSMNINPLNPELNPICYLLALLGAHRFLHVSRIRVKSLTIRLLMSYIYGAPILDVSRSHTTTHHSR